MKIIYDCMGADAGVEEIIKGIDLYLDENRGEGFLVGREEEISAALRSYPAVAESYTVVPATQVIENTENPAFALKRKKDSSTVVGLNLLKEGKADGFLSAGSTGGLLAGGMFILGRIPGVERPGLPVVLPGAQGTFLLMDSGANMDCTVRQLISFAKMGKIYSERVLGKENPSVGLLNVGKEPGKGNAQVKEAYKAFEEQEFNFIGNTEARDLFFSAPDIVIADGFVGNTVLKNIEGTGMYIMGALQKLLSKAGSDDPEFLKKSGQVVKELAKLFDYTEYGGAPLLGIDGAIVKAHGSSDAKAFKNATIQMKNFLERDVIAMMKEEFKGEEK